MNARLSMHCSLKRTKRRENNSVRLRIHLSVQPQHNIFKNFLVVQKCRSRPVSCNLLLNYEPLNSKCLKYISKQGFKKKKGMANY